MISIVIVTFNARDIIRNCIIQILKAELCVDQIIVVDNNSQNGVIQCLKRRFFDKITFVENSQNIGFTKACNQGARVARGEYLLFLNPDVEILKGNFLRKLLDFAGDKEDVGTIGPRFLNPDGTLQPSAGRFPSLFRVIIDRIKFLNLLADGILIRRTAFYKGIQETDWLSAGCFLVKRNLFRELGGFNESIFMYGEDYDFCYRVKEKGYKNYFFPDVELIHQDTGRRNPLRRPHKYFHMRKGLLIFFKNHRSRISFLSFLYLTKIESIIRLFLMVFRRFESSEERELWHKHYLEAIRLKV